MYIVYIYIVHTCIWFVCIVYMNIIYACIYMYIIDTWWLDGWLMMNHIVSCKRGLACFRHYNRELMTYLGFKKHQKYLGLRCFHHQTLMEIWYMIGKWLINDGWLMILGGFLTWSTCWIGDYDMTPCGKPHQPASIKEWRCRFWPSLGRTVVWKDDKQQKWMNIRSSLIQLAKKTRGICHLCPLRPENNTWLFPTK